MKNRFTMHALSGCLMLALTLASTGFGQVKGKAVFKGTPPKLRPIAMDADAVCAGKHPTPMAPETVVVKADGSLKNVFVYVSAGLEGKTFPTPAAPVVLDQDGCTYKPHVFGIMPGQTMKIVNSDATTHNVHALAEVNQEFNIGQQKGQPPVMQKFAKAEVTVPIVCNQHPWMRAVAHVISNPHFAVTDENGVFDLKGLPPGNYTLTAIHERFGSATQKITVVAGKPVTADFTFAANQAYHRSPLRVLPALVID
jgi:plastocyanin